MSSMKKNVVVIGSTGTVGQNIINVINLNKELFNVVALVAQNSFQSLIKQAVQVNCPLVILESDTYFKEAKEIASFYEIALQSGISSVLGIIENEKEDTLIVIASSSTDSITYFFEAIKANKNIAIANKESIVCAGEFLSSYLAHYTKKIIPIDSEHNSLFQLIENAKVEEIQNVIITGSGGPFIDISLSELKNIKKEDALRHPTWKMGGKITIDSATFMNKCFEFIEAAYLFNLPPNMIEVVIHRQSILHSGVNYKDGTFIGNFYYPSMEIPAAYALYYPNRLKTNNSCLSLGTIANLHFEFLDEQRFISIKLARDALKLGGNAPTILNVANEVAVNCYLKNQINFIQIMDVVEFGVNKIQNKNLTTLEELKEECKYITKLTENYIKTLMI